MAVPSSDKLEILVKSQTGETATYLIPWQIYGTPLLASGSISNLRTAKRGPRTASSADGRGRTTLGRRGLPNDFGEADNPWGVRLESPIAPAEEPVPAYMETLKEFQTMQAVDTEVLFSHSMPSARSSIRQQDSSNGLALPAPICFSQAHFLLATVPLAS